MEKCFNGISSDLILLITDDQEADLGAVIDLFAGDHQIESVIFRFKDLENWGRQQRYYRKQT